MDVLMNIIQVATSSIITAFITYCFTKRKIVPDKLEYAYSRIYYPLYRIVKSSDSHEKLLLATKEKILRYEKHISRTTIACCRSLDEHIGTNQEKKYYNQLLDDIYDNQHKLRISLGYLEPSYIQFFRYLSKRKKLYILFLASIYGTIIGIYGINITQNMELLKTIFDYIFSFFVSTLVLCIFIFVIQSIITVAQLIFSLIKKILRYIIKQTERLF